MDLNKFNNIDILMICGLPHSGKSMFSKQHFGKSGRKRINRKEIRKLLYEMTSFGEKYSEKNFPEVDEALVKHVERKIVEQLLHDKHRILIDNSSVSAQSRKVYLNIAQQMKKSIGIIFLNTAAIKCIERNRESADPLPSSVISNLSVQINLPVPSEGFSQLLVIDDK